MAAIDDAVQRLLNEVNNKHHGMAADVRLVIAELRRLQREPIAVLERWRNDHDEPAPDDFDDRVWIGRRTGIADALTAVRAAVKGGA